ncbi:hypothetical protein DFH07DRAFT_1057870 [Mycena maculata]|uniref:Uncharacterized protein n=1 Tax=Mycena maculata TaxID=230809 RepID=A0AAD7JWZ9_9AGAR|nr:hypothetical protein DFH07DRAFT_1057870 [Mycena maculata]
MAGRLTHRDMLSYGFKQGQPWGEDRRELERAFDQADRSRAPRRSLSSGFPSNPQLQTVQRQYSTSSAPGYAGHSGYGSGYLPRASYSSPGRTYPQDPWMQYRDASHSSRTSSPVPSYASGSHGRSYSRGYGPSSGSSYTLERQSSNASRYSSYGYSGSESSTSYAPRSVYDSDDEGYTHAHAPSAESEPYFASSRYAETFVIEPSDSGSEASYSGYHEPYGDSELEYSDSGSGSSGSEGDSVYSEGADDEYEDYEDDSGSHSDDGGYSDD